jgi:hypothetical protein
MSAHAALEHSEHIAHAGHAGDRLGTYIGVTMAILGVLLAFSSAMVGSQRTELLQSLVEQQNAHAKYQAQNVKHRNAYLTLTQIHAMGFGPNANGDTVNKDDARALAKTVNRYYEEYLLAQEWTELYEPVVKAHLGAEGEYESALLAAEIGIVAASIALLWRRRSVWMVSIVLGIAALAVAGHAWASFGGQIRAGEAKVTLAKARYEEKRAEDKEIAIEQKFVDGVLAWAGAGEETREKPQTGTDRKPESK